MIFFGFSSQARQKNKASDQSLKRFTFFSLLFSASCAFETDQLERRSCFLAEHTCGETDNRCYDNNAALLSGYAETPSGKCLELVTNNHGVEIWKEFLGDRILRSNGVDEWQMKLNINGKGLSEEPFTDYNQIAGRVCPPNVYLDDSNKVEEDLCLYYDAGNAPQKLNQPGSSQSDIVFLGLDKWTLMGSGTGDWFVGNIKTCADKGMRLPTLYETDILTPPADHTPDTVTGLSTDDVAVVYAGNRGVPSEVGQFTWTASAGLLPGADGCTYWAWGTGDASIQHDHHLDFNNVRCVTP